jgi:hypothetical protein
MDCNWNADQWSTPAGPSGTQPGCHNMAVNVESGGTTNGDADSTNTRYVEWGDNQSPNDSGNPGLGGLWSLGDPGTADNLHSGCFALDTDGTTGGTGNGCGTNPNGVGIEDDYDYYQFYCPIIATLPKSSFPVPPPDKDPTGTLATPSAYQCSPGQPVGSSTLAPKMTKGSDTSAVMTILSQGLVVYYGMDDNTDNGEHDGFSQNNHTAGAVNGPSDGGAVTLSVAGTESLSDYLSSLAASGASAADPEGVANVSAGFCADGICSEGTTDRQTVYYGCDDPSDAQTSAWTKNGVDGATDPQNDAAADRCTPGTAESGNVYENDAPASTMEPYGCSSGGPDSSETACYENANGTLNPDGADGYRSATPQQMNAEPGIQTYQDPDPQRSLALPVATPGLYLGTCGVYVNGGGGAGGPGVTGQKPGYIGPSKC